MVWNLLVRFYQDQPTTSKTSVITLKTDTDNNDITTIDNTDDGTIPLYDRNFVQSYKKYIYIIDDAVNVLNLQFS